jgi:hypothetical protein
VERALEAGTILKPATLAQMEVPTKLNNGSLVQGTTVRAMVWAGSYRPTRGTALWGTAGTM